MHNWPVNEFVQVGFSRYVCTVRPLELAI